MKTKQKTHHWHTGHITINPELNQFEEIVLFTDKLAKATEELKAVKLPGKKWHNPGH